MGMTDEQHKEYAQALMIERGYAEQRGDDAKVKEISTELSRSKRATRNADKAKVETR